MNQICNHAVTALQYFISSAYCSSKRVSRWHSGGIECSTSEWINANRVGKRRVVQRSAPLPPMFSYISLFFNEFYLWKIHTQAQHIVKIEILVLRVDSFQFLEILPQVSFPNHPQPIHSANHLTAPLGLRGQPPGC